MPCRYSGSRVEVYIVVVACGLLLVVQMQIERLEYRIAQRMIDCHCRCNARVMRESVNTNQVTIQTDSVRENVIRDMLKHEGKLK